MSTFEEKWNNAMTKADNERKYLTWSYSNKSRQDRVRWSFYSVGKFNGTNQIKLNSFEKAKKEFHNAAMAAEYCFYKYKNIWPYWLMKPYTYALLSDNKVLIDRYARLPVDEIKIYDDPKEGVPKGFNYAFQGLLIDDQGLIQKGLDCFNEDIRKRKGIGFNKSYIACTKALASRDEKGLLKGLKLFERKAIKSQAIKGDICEEVLSFFPLAFAKMAWLKGMEIDPESKYMPLELLRIDPLEEYTIPYWFLRDFYREQGINWRYDPVYPELQGWDNDPENPNRNNGGFFKKLFS